LFIFLLSFSLILSCNKRVIEPEKPIVVVPEKPEDPEEEPKEPKPKPKFFDENSWIYDQMVKNYLWAEDMPHEDSTDKNLEPKEYYYALLNREKDRYSYVKDNYDEIADYWNGNLESFGFRYTLFSQNGSNLKLAVSLVLKGGPAENAGLKRGDIISAINGSSISTSNIEELFEQKSSSFTVTDEKDITRTVSINKAKFQIDPLQHYKIIQTGGKKIGYLVYTQFLFNYEQETNRIFKYFKDEKIDEMVLDLRFNPGGVTPIAEVMTSLMAPDLGNRWKLFYGKPNAYQTNLLLQNPQQGDGSRNFVNVTENLSKLERVFVITSKSSASSSELLVNCLRPYRPVITVGGNTYGKNVISIILKDETAKYPFTLMPAWSKILNTYGQSEYGGKDGIVPDYPVSDNILPYRPLGDSLETMLHATISVIKGSSARVKARQKEEKYKLMDPFHHFDTGTGFLGNKRYN
jgi:carboxyl-terminal processing protease